MLVSRLSGRVNLEPLANVWLLTAACGIKPRGQMSRILVCNQLFWQISGEHCLEPDEIISVQITAFGSVKGRGWGEKANSAHTHPFRVMPAPDKNVQGQVYGSHSLSHCGWVGGACNETIATSLEIPCV